MTNHSFGGLPNTKQMTKPRLPGVQKKTNQTFALAFVDRSATTRLQLTFFFDFFTFFSSFASVASVTPS
jgi:hypothetical protein